MHIRSPIRLKFAALALVAMAGSATLVSTQTAQADPFVAGLLGGLVGAAIVAPAYSVPAYPVYAAPQPVYVQPAPVVVYEEPVYAQPVYPAPAYTARPAYSGPSGYRPAYPVRRSLAEVDAYPPRHGGPRVVTYEDSVGGQQFAGAEPWSPEWYDYCRAKFRSFDDRNGTFLGYDGQRHFCTVK